MVEDEHFRESIASRMLRSKFTRVTLLLGIFVVLVSLSLKIVRAMRGEVTIGHLDQDIAIILSLGTMFLASSNQKWARTFFNNTWILIALWFLVVVFTVHFIDPPGKYWVFGFIGVLIICHYVPHWYRRRQSR